MAEVMAILAEEGMVATEPPVDIAERAQKFREEIESDGPGSMWVLCDETGRMVGNGGLHESGAAGVLTPRDRASRPRRGARAAAAVFSTR